MRIKEIMTNRLYSISPTVPVWEAACKMQELDIGALAVSENGELIGMITDRDITCRVVAPQRELATTRVRDVMTRDVSFCYGDQTVADAAALMERNHIRRLAVLNRDRTMAGFLSVDDLARYSHHLAGEVLEAAQPTH